MKQTTRTFLVIAAAVLTPLVAASCGNVTVGGFSEATVEHLLMHYGTEAAGLYNLARREPALAQPLHPGHPAIAAEVVHAARREFARRVEDVLVRRIHLYYETADQGRLATARTAELLGRELNWTSAEIGRRAEEYLAILRPG